MGHVPGAEKDFFLIRGRGRPTVYGGRAGYFVCRELGTARVRRTIISPLDA